MPRELCKEAVHEQRAAPAIRIFSQPLRNYLFTRSRSKRFCASCFEKICSARESTPFLRDLYVTHSYFGGGRRLLRIRNRTSAALLRRVEQLKTVRQFCVGTLIMGRNVFDEPWICANKLQIFAAIHRGLRIEQDERGPILLQGVDVRLLHLIASRPQVICVPEGRAGVQERIQARVIRCRHEFSVPRSALAKCRLDGLHQFGLRCVNFEQPAVDSDLLHALRRITFGPEMLNQRLHRQPAASTRNARPQKTAIDQRRAAVRHR